EDRRGRPLLHHPGVGYDGGLEGGAVHGREGHDPGREEDRVRHPVEGGDEAAEPVADAEEVEDRLAERGDEERRGEPLPRFEVTAPDAEGAPRREHRRQSRRAWPVSVRKTSSRVARRRVKSSASSAENMAGLA